MDTPVPVPTAVQIKEAVAVVADRAYLRKMTRHNAEDFPSAIAVLVAVARDHLSCLREAEEEE